MAFYWLCRPGEAYAPSSARSDSAPFRLCDVEFAVAEGHHPADIIPLEMLDQSSGVRLTFTAQKNGNAGEKMAHGLSGDLLLCPTRALARLVHALRTQHAERTTPLHCVNIKTHLSVHARHITTALRHAARLIQGTTGIDPHKISAGSLRPGGATALLCARIDHDTIKLAGRWKSDAMLRYLHTQAVPAMNHIAAAMLQHGNYNFQPNNNIPVQAQAVLQALPPPP
jgi:hypothetical protein